MNMLVAIIGENCVGKSTLANRVQGAIGAEIVSGRGYLRLARSEAEAEARFRGKLKEAVEGPNVIYVISEPEQLDLLPEGAVRILVSATLDGIKARFRERMRGALPAPVERMLEKKHGAFDAGEYDYRFDGETGDTEALCAQLRQRVR